ncbi:MAG: YkgJ family cysteine cluster protein [Sphaerochaetaceae bacterium]|nr:YkgJ family cysteine cluster protein [Sphaerochaetaceae bacterium]
MACFYEKGLKFTCQGCRYCCSSEPGYVFLSEADVALMSEGLGLTREKFIDTYCRYVDMGAFYMVSLLEKENYDCIFLTEKGCKAYEYRPTQCRTYPFWAHIMESRETWDEEAKSCPGMNKGQLHSKNEINRALDSRLKSEPLVIFKK